jgi:hypothetical protein
MISSLSPDRQLQLARQSEQGQCEEGQAMKRLETMSHVPDSGTLW